MPQQPAYFSLGVLTARIEATKSYLAFKGEPVDKYAPDFLAYHAAHGRTPAEIHAIACNQPVLCVHGKAVCGICAEARQ